MSRVGLNAPTSTGAAETAGFPSAAALSSATTARLQDALGVVRRSCNRWPTQKTKRVVEETAQEVGRASWKPVEIQRFAKLVLEKHGVETPPWPERTWSFMYEKCCKDGRGSDLPLRFARAVFERLAGELEMRAMSLGDFEKTEAQQAAQTARAAEEVRAADEASEQKRYSDLLRELRREAREATRAEQEVAKEEVVAAAAAAAKPAEPVGEPLPQAWREQQEKLHGHVFFNEGHQPGIADADTLALACYDGSGGAAAPPLCDFLAALDRHEEAEDSKAVFASLAGETAEAKEANDVHVGSLFRFIRDEAGVDIGKLPAGLGCSAAELWGVTGSDQTTDIGDNERTAVRSMSFEERAMLTKFKRKTPRVCDLAAAMPARPIVLTASLSAGSTRVGDSFGSRPIRSSVAPSGGLLGIPNTLPNINLGTAGPSTSISASISGGGLEEAPSPPLAAAPQPASKPASRAAQPKAGCDSDELLARLNWLTRVG